MFHQQDSAKLAESFALIERTKFGRRQHCLGGSVLIDFLGPGGRCLPMKREASPPLKREKPTPGLDFSGPSAQ